MTWTTQTPTQRGWYWVVCKDLLGRPGFPEPIAFRDLHDIGQLGTNSEGSVLDLEFKDAQWYGPIEPPEGWKK